jgi:hypothetical protein
MQRLALTEAHSCLYQHLKDGIVAFSVAASLHCSQ